MKATQVNHSWHRVTVDWDGDTAFAGLASKAGFGFRASAVELSGGVLVLAGVNSGGKSRLLRSIWSETHDPQSAWTETSWTGSTPTLVTHVDLFDLLERQAHALRAPDLQDQVDAAGLTPVRQPDLREICYVLGRKYDSVSIAEIDATDLVSTPELGRPPRFREEVVPYFEVVTGGETYASPALSRGELSALTLHWVLQTAPSDTVLLLDEPDLMLSPLSAERALNLVVDTANTRKSPTVLATHSYLGLARAPRSAQVLLRVAADGATSLSNPNDYALWEALRVAPPIQLVFVVEDRMAQLLLGEVLRLVEFQHFDISDIWIGGSAAEVRAVGKLPHFADAHFAMWGVLDGNEKLGRREPHCIKLPGKASPEDGAIEIATSYPTLITEMVDALERALERSVGDDAHDRVHSIAKAIGHTGESLVIRAWQQWLTGTDDGRAALAEFTTQMKSVHVPHTQP